MFLSIQKVHVERLGLERPPTCRLESSHLPCLRVFDLGRQLRRAMRNACRELVVVVDPTDLICCSLTAL